jgi:hypothetical protein
VGCRCCLGWRSPASTPSGMPRRGSKDKGRILDQVVEVTGWHRDTAGRRLRQSAVPSGSGRQVAARPRKQRARRYSYHALTVLQKV